MVKGRVATSDIVKMPPKKPTEPSKKTEMKKKEKNYRGQNVWSEEQEKFKAAEIHSAGSAPGDSRWKTAKQLEKEKAEKMLKKDDKKKTAVV